MDRLINLNDLTKMQQGVACCSKNEFKMGVKSGKSTACFVGGYAYCRGNENINVCIVSKDISTFDKYIEQLADIDDITVERNKYGTIITFTNTHSTLVISKFNPYNISNTQGDKLIEYNILYGTYTFIYFDNINIVDLDINTEGFDNTFEFMSNCVKTNFVFVH